MPDLGDGYNSLRRWRKEPADRAGAVLSRILRIFPEAADGGVKKWPLPTSGVLEVSSNCAKFRFEKVLEQAVLYALFLTNERENRLPETAGIWTEPSGSA